MIAACGRIRRRRRAPVCLVLAKAWRIVQHRGSTTEEPTMTDADKLAQFMSGRAPGAALFGDPKKASDSLLAHPHSMHCTATETWWYQFFIPELGLNGEIYYWVHTNLRTMSGGVWIFKGIKKHHLQAEHFNWKNRMPYPEVTREGLFAPEIGLRIDIVEPLRRQRIVYDDPRTGTQLRLE